MLTDEQLIERIRSGLRAELSGIEPPGDLLRRAREPAVRHRRWSRGRAVRRSATGRRFPIPSGGSVFASVLVAIAIVVTVVALVVVGHGRGVSAGKGNGLESGRSVTGPAAHVLAMLDGIPQSGTVLGNPNAPVTVLLFDDLECPLCRDLALGDAGGLPMLIQRDVRDGRVKIQYRSFCTSTCSGPGRRVFDTQQAAAYAAGAQHLFWDYAQLFYNEQGQEDTDYATQRYLNSLAEQIPKLDLKTWQTDRSDPVFLSQLRGDAAAANSAGITGTPTVIVEGPRGSEHVVGSLPPYATLRHAIEQVR
jgi:protein-disulfide isomerase